MGTAIFVSRAMHEEPELHGDVVGVALKVIGFAI